ncbi:Wzz/FepE/Etk N-terminal domain-containing protein [Aidingimonas lacisalsi]|uniref:Wzz/FepE/Etk N-terminal domain-containing protein n=1 Tax=Aidingimonas lacisalsi TaxID=2604086 RepID=UPI0011D28023|nr:Wzz/FepE/Etk N-terminal domain-containing protein [Aidingimonas lacisalsi]
MNNQTRRPADDISLVDLALILVRRWRIMLGVFLSVIAFAIAYVLLSAETYTYTSLYGISEIEGEQGGTVGLESPATVLTRLQTQTLPTEIRRYLADQDLERLPFDINAGHLEGSHLVSLTTRAPEEQGDAIEHLHQQVFEALAGEQQALVERTRSSLEARLDGLQKAMQETGIADETMLETTRHYEDLLASLTEGEASQVASRSLGAQGASSTLIIGLAVVLGMLLSVIAAYLWHFISIVRANLND